MNGELARMKKITVVDYFNELSQNLPAATKKNYEKSKSVFTVCGLRFEPRFS
jgi:hypothetical protein